jgi:uncharacterized protein YggE
MNMTRTITVKGVGKVSASPDYVVITMGLEAKSKDYETTLELAAQKIEQLNASLEKIGFEKKAVKTTSFNVRTDYSSVKDKNGNYKRVFNGYYCEHSLKVEFDFDTKRLAQTLYAISKCLANPELSISFTVKDATAVNTELLRSATTNARDKAKILCETSGVALGELLSIDYNWGELNVVSRTEYMLEEECMPKYSSVLEDIDIAPDDINVSDTATFVWEIK